MRILSIETSCDETAVSMVEVEGTLPAPRFHVLGNALLSQIDIHKEYGGVYPNLAKREHSRNLVPLLKEVLEQSCGRSKLQAPSSKQIPNDKIQKLKQLLAREPELLKQFLEYIPTITTPAIDAIAVTYGPGLEPALWVGVNFAKALHEVWGVPVLPVNHMEGHIYSVLLNRVDMSLSTKLQEPRTKQIQNTKNKNQISFPALALLISGGHTELVHIADWGKHEIIGATRDDAVGEAFDKVARILGLPYPGGPEISRYANKARNKNQDKRTKNQITLPRPMIDTKDFDFSFSGLKTAVLYLVRELGELTSEQKANIAREFEDAVADVLVVKTRRALSEYGASTLIVAGGVAANAHIRTSLSALASEYRGLIPVFPDMALTGDNALMIAVAAFVAQKTGHTSPPLLEELRACGTLSLS